MSTTTTTSSTTTSSSTTYSASGSTVTQYGFFFDQSRCVHCFTCAVACKDWNNLEPGSTKWLRLFEYETGVFPAVRITMQWVPCYHCAKPACIAVAAGAMFKEPKYGAVLIDPSKATSGALRDAWAACPYGSIVFDSDSVTATASKCTMCIDRLEQGLMPTCVMACGARALDFGLLTDLQKKYGSNSDLADLPPSSQVSPSVVFKPIGNKPAPLVPYDANAAMTLLQNRGTLPQTFQSTNDLLSPPQPGEVGRYGLNLKPSTSEQLMAATQNDDS